jgi:hypothetical protein
VELAHLAQIPIPRSNSTQPNTALRNLSGGISCNFDQKAWVIKKRTKIKGETLFSLLVGKDKAPTAAFEEILARKH